MATEPIILEMRSITKEFPGVKALDKVSLTVKAGEIHSICGENGAGKSTLMKVLSGVYPYGTYDGDIVFQGAECHFKDIKSSEAAGIVIIHQELALIPELSITENIFLGNEQARGGIVKWGCVDVRIRFGECRLGVGDQAVQPLGHHGVPTPVEISAYVVGDVSVVQTCPEVISLALEPAPCGRAPTCDSPAQRDGAPKHLGFGTGGSHPLLPRGGDSAIHRFNARIRRQGAHDVAGGVEAPATVTVVRDQCPVTARAPTQSAQEERMRRPPGNSSPAVSLQSGSEHLEGGELLGARDDRLRAGRQA